MVKGVSRRVIVVESPDPRIFEQAIFILPTDGGGVSSRQLVDQAVRIARSYARGQGGARTRWRPPAWLWAVWGAASCACWTPSTAKSADNCPLTTGSPVYIIFSTEKYNGI